MFDCLEKKFSRLPRCLYHFDYNIIYRRIYPVAVETRKTAAAGDTYSK